MKKLTFILLLLSMQAHALPLSVEVWFLSPKKTAFLDHSVDTILFSELLAENDNFECQPMGDGCFHPQLGFIDKSPMDTKKEEKKKEVQVKTFNASDTNMINCDEKYYFDMFCGKAKKEKYVEPKVEIWVDTSSSLREVDYSQDHTFCERRTFISTLLNDCPRGSLHVSVFDTSIKEMGDSASLCLNYGLNDQKRLMDWIQGSDAKKLIIITDIAEYSSEFSLFLTSIGAKVKGADTETIEAHELSKYVKQVVKVCKK